MRTDAPSPSSGETDPAGRQKLLQALGLCRKAGKLIFGTDVVCAALAEPKKPFAVFSAAGNAANTEKRLADKCRYYGVRLFSLPFPGEELAAAIGKTGRCAAVAVTDEQLCRLAVGAYEKISTI